MKQHLHLFNQTGVQNAINNLIKDRTTIVIAHRLSTIHNADKIFVFKSGGI